MTNRRLGPGQRRVAPRWGTRRRGAAAPGGSGAGGNDAGQAGDQPQRRRFPPYAVWINTIQRNVAHAPVYQSKPKPAAGSSRVDAVLGPLSYLGRRNDARSNLPRGIILARATYPDHHFKAGHMLNCDLGGDGRNRANMTILTASANTAMTRFDNSLKRAVILLEMLYRHFYRQRVEPGTLNAGIVVSIVADRQVWGCNPPDSYISMSLTMAVRTVGALDPDPALPSAAERNRIIGLIHHCVDGARGTIDNYLD